LIHELSLLRSKGYQDTSDAGVSCAFRNVHFGMATVPEMGNVAEAKYPGLWS
jgi:hypothetical protein